MNTIKLIPNGYNELGQIYIAENTPYGTITITPYGECYVTGQGCYAHYEQSATATKADDEDFELHCDFEWDIDDWDAYNEGDGDCCDWDNPRAICIDGERFAL